MDDAPANELSTSLMSRTDRRWPRRQRTPVRFSERLGYLINNLPLEHIGEVGKALVTDPPVIIFRRVPLMQYVREISNHKLGAAELTMIMIPVRILRVIGTMNQSHALQILLLTLESPI